MPYSPGDSKGGEDNDVWLLLEAVRRSTSGCAQTMVSGTIYSGQCRRRMAYQAISLACACLRKAICSICVRITSPRKHEVMHHHRIWMSHVMGMTTAVTSSLGCLRLSTTFSVLSMRGNPCKRLTEKAVCVRILSPAAEMLSLSHLTAV